MRSGIRSYVRITTIALLAVCLYGAQMSQVTAEVVCRPAAALAIADGDGDGVVTLGEIDAINAAAGGNAELQAVRDQLAAQGITGIQYAGCDADAGGDSTGDTSGSGTTGGGDVDGSTETDDPNAAAGEDGESVNGQTVVVHEDGTVTINGTPVAEAEPESTPLATKLPAVGTGDADGAVGSGIGSSTSILVMASVGALVMGGSMALKAVRRH